MRVLGQKPVAGMDGACSAFAGRRNDLSAVEIGRNRRCAGNFDRSIGRRNGRRSRIGGVINHDRLQPERLDGAQNTERDLAAIGNQDARERPAAAWTGPTLRHYDFAFAGFGQSPFKKMSVMVRAIRCTSSGRLPMV